MSEISTDHELLVVGPDPGGPAGAVARSAAAPESDGGILHRYGPQVESCFPI